MKRRRAVLLTATSLFLAAQAFCDVRYDAKKLSEALPRAKSLGERWHSVHPERWLTVKGTSVTAMYELRSEEPGKIVGSVIADCFVYKNEILARKALKARRKQISAYPTAVITNLDKLSTNAFASHFKGEEVHGERITFAVGNVVVTLSPSKLSGPIAEQIVKKLKKG